MLTRFIALIVAASLVIQMGIHLPFLKSVAWAGMTIHNLHEAPLKVALQNAFDGNHPCNICRTLHQIIHTENKNLQKSITHPIQADPFWVSLRTRFFSDHRSKLVIQCGIACVLNHELPQVPPPKHLLS